MAPKAAKGSMQTFVSRTFSPPDSLPDSHPVSRSIPGSRGFTLLEVLVVVSLVSILTGVVILGFTGADTQQAVKGYAQRFAFRIELARQQALNRNREWGIYVAEQDYHFAEFSPEAGKWEEQSQRPFDSIEVPEYVRLRIETEGVGELPFEDEDLPQILVFSSGEVTPFTLYLELPGDNEPWVVSTDGLSRARAQRESVFEEEASEASRASRASRASGASGT
jgi:general secretion pathway protein H